MCGYLYTADVITLLEGYIKEHEQEMDNKDYVIMSALLILLRGQK